MAMMKMSEALGRKVVATDTAEEIGEIRSFVVDPTGRRLVKVHITGRKKKADLLDWSSLRFGPDVVMASTDAARVDVADDRELDSVKGDISYLGARVLDTDGFEHGTVDDVEFDADDGSIVRVHGESSIEIDRVRSIGSYAVVIDAGT